jgi:hypothetical protein
MFATLGTTWLNSGFEGELLSAALNTILSNWGEPAKFLSR